jgi:pimeloyl-ACP methyl ester carboxylesterase
MTPPPDRLRRLISLSTLPLVLAPLGCATRADPQRQLRTVIDACPCAPRPDTLMVLLPGSRSPIEEFIDEGYVSTVREQGLAVDLRLVDASVDYYQNRSIVRRLETDVFEPSRTRGYRKTWIAGISIGAVGAMLYARDHPQDVDGVVLIAPFLGSRLTAIDVRNGGGLARWPAQFSDEDSEIDRTLWSWLKAQVDPANPDAIPVFLAYGESDRFAFNQQELAAALPPSRVFTQAGGHDWNAWRPLWRRVVAGLPIERTGG